jgi:hypothetical protein
MAWWVGYGRVAVSDAFWLPEATGGRGRGFGREKRREFRKRFAVGERF